MKWEHYEIIIYDERREYRFISEGPKGRVTKIVRFAETEDPDVYNFVFGNLNKDRSIDDKTVDDNKDLYKIIGTIKAIIYDFTTFYPGKFVFFGGSTPTRTRLFRMILSNNIESFKRDFVVYSVKKDKENI